MSSLVTAAELRDFFNDKGAHDDSHDSEEAELATAAGGRLHQVRYQALALINPNEKGESLKQDLKVQPGRTLTGTILGTDGKPLAGATTDATMHIRVVGTGPVPQPTASFTLTNLNPRRTIPVEFRHKEKGLGLFKVIRCDAAEPLTVQLQPYGSVIGRILDKDGKPIPDVPMQLFHESAYTDIRPITDRDGRFRVDELLAGHNYHLVGGPFPDFKIEPGKVKDLGDGKPQGQ
jgi:hypothetical protein